MNAVTHTLSNDMQRTVATLLGEVVWLLSQSPNHRDLPIRALEWSFIPAILADQFRIFRFGPMPGLGNLDPKIFESAGVEPGAIEQLPLGVAAWARLSAAAEAKLEAGEHLSRADWRSGDRLWLMELIAPFATPQNNLSKLMLLDLMRGPFIGTPFNLHRTDPATGRRNTVRMANHLGAKAH